MPCSRWLAKHSLFSSSVSSEKSVKMPQVPLVPKTPLRTVTWSLLSTRTAARLALDERSPSITIQSENVMKMVSRLSGRSVVTVTTAFEPWAWMVMGWPGWPSMSSTSKPR